MVVRAAAPAAAARRAPRKIMLTILRQVIFDVTVEVA
jgi:hypothetical protein